MISNRVVRYGYANTLYRVLSVEVGENVACSGGALHKVRAVAVSDGVPATWWIRGADLPRYV